MEFPDGFSITILVGGGASECFWESNSIDNFDVTSNESVIFSSALVLRVNMLCVFKQFWAKKFCTMLLGFYLQINVVPLLRHIPRRAWLSYLVIWRFIMLFHQCI